MTTPTLELWELQPNESAAAFETFFAWRDMGPARNLPGVASSLKLALSTVHEWSARHKWGIRLRAYVRHQDELVKQANLDAVIEMNARHRRIAGAVLSKLENRLQLLDLETIKAGDLPRWLDVAVKVERQSHGEETDPVVLKFRGMSDEDLIEYLRQNIPPDQLPPAPDDTDEGDDVPAVP